MIVVLAPLACSLIVVGFGVAVFAVLEFARSEDRFDVRGEHWFFLRMALTMLLFGSAALVALMVGLQDGASNA